MIKSLKNINSSNGFHVFSNATTFLYSSLNGYTMKLSSSVAGGSTVRIDEDSRLPLPLLGVVLKLGLHRLDMEGWM